MSTTAQRRKAILSYIQTHQKGEVNYFSKLYEVSEVTIRNDLNNLEKKGCVTRCYGGALLNNSFAFDRPLLDKIQLNNEIKSKIGQYAASLVKNGDKIILDSGSTTEQIAHHLQEKKNITVMTNAINVAYHLASQNDIELMVTGGIMRKNSYSLYGARGEDLLNSFRFDTLFIGVDGFNAQTGITTPHKGEASINRRMIEAAQKVVAVTDSSKFNRQSFCLIARPDQIDVLITDNGISQD